LKTDLAMIPRPRRQHLSPIYAYICVCMNPGARKGQSDRVSYKTPAMLIM
jgi:hypothetical protein